MSENELIDQARATGEYLAKRLEELRDIDIVGDIRGCGMFYGIEFVRDRVKKNPFPAEVGLTRRIVERAYQNGLILIAGMPGCVDGVNGDQLQLSPALVFTQEEIDEALRRLRKSVESVRSELVEEGVHSA